VAAGVGGTVAAGAVATGAAGAQALMMAAPTSAPDVRSRAIDRLILSPPFFADLRPDRLSLSGEYKTDRANWTAGPIAHLEWQHHEQEVLTEQRADVAHLLHH